MMKETIKQFCELYQTDLVLAKVQMPIMLEAFSYFLFQKKQDLEVLLDKYHIEFKGVI